MYVWGSVSLVRTAYGPGEGNRKAGEERGRTALLISQPEREPSIDQNKNWTAVCREGPGQRGPACPMGTCPVSLCCLGREWSCLEPEFLPLPPPRSFSLCPGYYSCTRWDGPLDQTLAGSSSPPRSPAFAQNLNLATKHTPWPFKSAWRVPPGGRGLLQDGGPCATGGSRRDEMYLEKCLETGAALSSLGLCLRDPG